MADATAATNPYATADSPERRRLRNNQYMATIIMLIAVALMCLLVAEQLATGWLALGERAGLSRRDLNLAEISLFVVTALWALLSLITAWGFFRHPATPSYIDYMHRNADRGTTGVLYTIVFLLLVAGICAAFAEQVLTGWLPLGERVNISRRDLNGLELFATAACLLWTLICLRTVWAVWRRDKRSWAWAQWVALLTALVGLTVFMAGAVHVHEVVPEGQTALDRIPAVLTLIAPGFIIGLSGIATYRYLTLGVDLAADQSVRNRLSKSPGAGAIIGLIVLIVGFSIASPLFLEPRAIAGALSTNVTNGIVAIGITLLMISGEFDLSVGSIFGAASLIFLLSLTEGVFGLPPMGPIPAVVVTLAFAAVLGLINGVLLIRTGIPSFIVTLGTLLAYRAITLVTLPEGRIIRYADYRLPDPTIEISPIVLIVLLALFAVAIAYFGYRQIPREWHRVVHRVRNFRRDDSAFRDVYLVTSFIWSVILTIAVAGLLLGAAYGIISLVGQVGQVISINFFDLANGRISSLPFSGPLSADINLRTGVIWWFLLVILFQYILSNMRYGGFSLAVGGNAGAARAQGISVSRVKVTNFIISACLCAVAGITFVSRVGSVGPNLGEGLELEVIAASVIGGTLLSGGYGSIVGALLGVLIFGLLRTGLVLVGMDPRIFYGVQGIIIIVAVVINTAVRRVRT